MGFWSLFLPIASTVIGAVGAKQEADAKITATNMNSELAQQAAEANAETVEANALIDIDFIRAQKTQEQIASERQRQDLEDERGQRLGNTRASLAAQGADLSSGTGLAVLKSQAGRYAVRAERIGQDLYATQKSLTKRSEDTARMSAKHAEDIRANAQFASQIATTQAGAYRTAGRLNTAGQIISGAGKIDFGTILQDRG